MLNANLTSCKNAELPDELDTFLRDFNKKFNQAYEARKKVINYLEDNYDYDKNDYSLIENDNNFVFGIDENGVKELISERSNA